MDPDYKIQEMDEKEGVLSSLLDSIEQYIKTTFELFKLQRIDKASEIVGTVISRTVAIIAFIAFFIMASFGAAFWLGEVLGRIWYGFFAVAAFYGLLGLIVYLFMHKGLKRIFANMIIHQTLK